MPSRSRCWTCSAGCSASATGPRCTRWTPWLSCSTIDHLDEYVAAPEQVLLLHHSIGNPALERVAALPEPKVLCYHNITPEAYFDSDVMRDAIRLGRAQLQTLPRLTGAAIANSNFSRRELLAVGFDTVEAMPVRTTFDAFRQGPPVDRTR